MKKIIFAIAFLATVVPAFAQEEEREGSRHREEKGGFKKENLFTGGGVTASFYSGGTILGISPSFGYSINKIIDAGITLNFTYTGEKTYTGDKYRQYVYGPGVFARIYPIRMIFIQGIFEHNFISQTHKYPSGYSLPSEKFQIDANSLLVGAGYCSGREEPGDLFFYLSIMVDVIKDINSPYVELLQDGSLRMQPIIKVGIQIPLFQGGGRRRR